MCETCGRHRAQRLPPAPCRIQTGRAQEGSGGAGVGEEQTSSPLCWSPGMPRGDKAGVPLLWSLLPSWTQQQSSAWRCSSFGTGSLPRGVHAVWDAGERTLGLCRICCGERG